MTTSIDFADTSATNNNETTPWERPKESRYEDLVLWPEYANRRLRFEAGTTWLRILPAIQGSSHSWMMPLHVIGYEGGRCNHPRTHKHNARSVFDSAYGWMKQNHPDGLYSKSNKTGIRLLSDPHSLFWGIVVREGEKPLARLFLGSGYDGSRGGAPGLGFEIWRLTRELDEDGDRVADVINPAEGRMICVEKTKPKGSRYPSYSLRLGRQPAPIADLIAKMDSEEISALSQLENVVRELTEEEQWACLEKVIAPENVAIIRSSLTRAE